MWGWSMAAAAEWEFCTSASGRAYAHDEIDAAKLTKYEVGQLSALMDRVARGLVLAKDVKYLRQYGLHELRFFGNKRSFRLLYAKRLDGRLLVAALFAAKQASKLKASEYKTAQERVAGWDTQSHPRPSRTRSGAWTAVSSRSDSVTSPMEGTHHGFCVRTAWR